MTAARTVDGPGFRIQYLPGPGYLRAYVFDGIDSIDVSIAMWRMLGAECAAQRVDRLLVVDGLLTSVGSTNFDVRSFRLNDEASLNVYDAAFAARMTEVFEADLKPTVRYTYETWQQRPLKEKLFEKFVLPLKSQL